MLVCPQPPSPIHARRSALAAMSKSPLGSRTGISGLHRPSYPSTCKCVLLPDLPSSVTEFHSCRSSHQILGYLPRRLLFSPPHIQSRQLYLRDILRRQPGLTPLPRGPLWRLPTGSQVPRSAQHLSQVPSPSGSKLCNPPGFPEEEPRPPQRPTGSPCQGCP